MGSDVQMENPGMDQTGSVLIGPNYRRVVAVWAMALVLTGLSLVAHVTSPSMWREPEQAWADRVAYHESKPSFAVRPMTTQMVQALHESFGWAYRGAFFGIQYLLLLMCGPSLYYYLRKLGFSFRYGLVGMGVFYLSLPIVMAFFDPVHTWDDFWVYLLVPLGLAAVLGGRFTFGALAMAAAILARETSVLFLPVGMLLVYYRVGRRIRPPLVYALVVAMAAVAVRWVWLGIGPGAANWEWEERTGLLAFNFASGSRTEDTLFSLVMALGALWPVGIYQAFRSGDYGDEEYNVVRFGAVFTIVGFVSATLLFMQARETRLFFPPFVFLVPLFLWFLQQHEAAIRSLWQRIPKGVGVGALLCLWLAAIGVAMVLFPGFEYRKWQDGNRVLFGLQLAASICFVILLWWERRLGRGSQDESLVR